MPNQAGSYFAETVTYICRHDSEGAIGIIINRPAKISLNALLQRIDIPTQTDLDLPVLQGGPVNEDQGLVLHSSDQRYPESDDLGNDLCLTFSRDVLEAMAAGTGPRRALFALGYAGWGPGQLESEISQHAWLTLNADSQILFTVPAKQRLAYAQSLTGVDLALLSGRIGHD